MNSFGKKDRGQGVKKKNSDGSINKNWLEIHGQSQKRPKGARNSGNDHPESLSDVVDWVDPYEDMI